MSDFPLSVLHKHPKTRNFTQIENDTLRDQSLSFRARGLLAYLLSLPNGSKIDSTTLADRTTEGRDAIRTAYNELDERGYADREKRQDDHGKWSTTIHVYETPKTESQASGNQSSVSQAVPYGDKTEIQEEDFDRELSLVCSLCATTGFPSLSALEDHQDAGCGIEDDGLSAAEAFAQARDAVRRSGGAG